MCFDCGWKKVAEVIDEMLDDTDKYGFADEFITSVRSQARDRQHITPKQKDGVRNVWKGAQKTAEKKKEREENEEKGQFDRRYEGYEPNGS